MSTIPESRIKNLINEMLDILYKKDSFLLKKVKENLKSSFLESMVIVSAV